MIDNSVYSRFRLFLATTDCLPSIESKTSVPIEDIQKMIDGFHVYHQLQLQQYGGHAKVSQHWQEYFQEMLTMLDILEHKLELRQQSNVATPP